MVKYLPNYQPKISISSQWGLSLTISLAKRSFSQFVIYKLPSNINVATSWPRGRRLPELLLHRVRSVCLAFSIFRPSIFTPIEAGNLQETHNIYGAISYMCRISTKRHWILKWGRIHWQRTLISQKTCSSRRGFCTCWRGYNIPKGLWTVHAIQRIVTWYHARSSPPKFNIRLIFNLRSKELKNICNPWTFHVSSVNCVCYRSNSFRGEPRPYRNWYQLTMFSQ